MTPNPQSPAAPGTPLPPARHEPDADCFRLGDLWQSPAGSRWVVTRVEARKAHLTDVATKRKQTRAWDAIGAHSSRSWVRLSCGAPA